MVKYPPRARNRDVRKHCVGPAIVEVDLLGHRAGGCRHLGEWLRPAQRRSRLCDYRGGGDRSGQEFRRSSLRLPIEAHCDRGGVECSLGAVCRVPRQNALCGKDRRRRLRRAQRLRDDRLLRRHAATVREDFSRLRGEKLANKSFLLAIWSADQPGGSMSELVDGEGRTWDDHRGYNAARRADPVPRSVLHPDCRLGTLLCLLGPNDRRAEGHGDAAAGGERLRPGPASGLSLSVQHSH